MTCPLQANFYKTVEFTELQNGKTTFGTCIHDALERYNQDGKVDEAVERFKYTWANPEILNAAVDIWPKYTSYGGLRQRGIEMLKEYDSKNKWESRVVVGTEHEFKVPFGDHELSGKVDLIEHKKSGQGKNILKVVDYKTTSKQPTLADLRLNVQFTVYIYASLQPEFWMGYDDVPGFPNGEELFEKYKKMDRRGVWYHLMGNKEINAGARDDGDFMRLYRVCLEIANAFEKQVFVPSINGDSCTFCPFTDICAAVIPVKDKLHTPIPEDEDSVLFDTNE
jgi:CRISPR/Cas system-associated exonuclease Cas4 (RecB family)